MFSPKILPKIPQESALVGRIQRSADFVTRDFLELPVNFPVKATFATKATFYFWLRAITRRPSSRDVRESRRVPNFSPEAPRQVR